MRSENGSKLFRIFNFYSFVVINPFKRSCLPIVKKTWNFFLRGSQINTAVFALLHSSGHVLYDRNFALSATPVFFHEFYERNFSSSLPSRLKTINNCSKLDDIYGTPSSKLLSFYAVRRKCYQILLQFVVKFYDFAEYFTLCRGLLAVENNLL